MNTIANSMLKIAALIVIGSTILAGCQSAGEDNAASAPPGPTPAAPPRAPAPSK